MNSKYWLTLFVLIYCGVSFAGADPQGADSTQPMYKIGVFGTLGVLHSNQTSGDYVLETAMPSGAGRSNEWDVNNFSKVAAQLNAYFSPKVTGQFQVITAYEADGSFQPEVEWLNLKYAFNQNAFIRVGRIGLPTFFDSGNHDVGYSYTWAHPPSELYYVMPIQSSDGVDAMYRFNIGQTQNSIKAFYGQNVHDGRFITTTSNGMWGIFDFVEYEQTTIHAGYEKRNTTTEIVQTGISDGGVDCTDVSVGINYEPGDWFVTSEWIQSQTAYTSDAMYVGAGYHIKKFTPYLIHSQNTAGSFPQGYIPTAIKLQLANRAQETNSVGVRMDFKKYFDIKLQYDRVTLSNNSNGFLANVPENTILYGSSFDLISAVIDFVF